MTEVLGFIRQKETFLVSAARKTYFNTPLNELLQYLKAGKKLEF